jgi:ABC-2 type transport system ATP-binding protein
MGEITVDVSGLTKKFGDFTAVDGISFTVGKGEIFGFLGPNGAGKSTTIKMLCGILQPTSGAGHVSGFDIQKENNKIRKIIGYMSQKFSLYEDLTVAENLEFFGSVYGLKGKKLAERSISAMELAGLPGQGNAPVKKLPVGFRQRLSLGAAILHDPPILFLDEPTSGVDPLMRRNFWDLIYRFAQEGKTIFVTTHYMEEAEHCDRIALIISGGIIAMDSPENLKQSLPYSVYALKTENFIGLFNLVSGWGFIHEAAIFGSDIHILCDKDFPLEKELAASLGGSWGGSYILERVNPTLEDVFVVNARKFSEF